MHTTIQRLLPLALTAALAGCASMNLNTSVPWAKKEKPQETRPQRMVAIWTDTVLHTAGKPSTRGFGGRLYFYDDKSKAVPVDGSLVVYAFDDSRGGVTRQPDKKFVFKAEDFVRHADETQLGQSYSVWLPWDALGGERTQVTLIPLFTSTTGDVLAGQQSKHVLQGREPLSATGMAQTSYDAGVRPASYAATSETEPEALADDERRLRSLSIPMTDSLKQRLIESENDPQATLYPGVGSLAPRGPSLRATGQGALGKLAAPGASGASLRTTMPHYETRTGESGTHRVQSPGEIHHTEMARIAAALEEAQTGQQQAASWGANRDPRYLTQSSSRFARQRSPVPGAPSAIPFPGPGRWQPPLESPPYGPQMSPAASPPGSLPASASTAGPLPR